MTLVEQRLPIARSYTNGPRYFQNQRQFMRELRIGIYRQDLEFMNQVVEDYYKYANKDKILINDIFAQMFYQPFDADWFSILNQELYETALLSILGNAIFQCYPVEEALAMLKAECTNHGQHCSDYLQLILTEQLLLRGCLAEAQQALERISQKYQDNAAPFWGWLYFFRGENEKALEIYTKTLKELKKVSGKNPAYFKTIPGIFFILALLKYGSLASLKEAEE